MRLYIIGNDISYHMALNNEAIQKTNPIIGFLFCFTLYFVIVTIKNISHCVKFISWYSCCNVVHVSKIEREMKCNRGYTLGF